MCVSIRATGLAWGTWRAGNHKTQMAPWCASCKVLWLLPTNISKNISKPFHLCMLVPLPLKHPLQAVSKEQRQVPWEALEFWHQNPLCCSSLYQPVACVSLEALGLTQSMCTHRAMDQTWHHRWWGTDATVATSVRASKLFVYIDSVHA